jgi:hypothetical protein
MVEEEKSLVDEGEMPGAESATIRTHFYDFKEYPQFMNLIASIRENVSGELSKQERAFEQFLYICDQYQEQPHLIDKYLQDIFEKLINTVKSAMGLECEIDAKLINECFKYMHCLTKLRGYKKIVMYLPHEVNDLEPVLALLAKQSKSDHETWQTRYMLLLWLSIIGMIPFDLNRFDANITHESQSIMNRLLDVVVVSPLTTKQNSNQLLIRYFLKCVYMF